MQRLTTPSKIRISGVLAAIVVVAVLCTAVGFVARHRAPHAAPDPAIAVTGWQLFPIHPTDFALDDHGGVYFNSVESDGLLHWPDAKFMPYNDFEFTSVNCDGIVIGTDSGKQALMHDGIATLLPASGFIPDHIAGSNAVGMIGVTAAARFAGKIIRLPHGYSGQAVTTNRWILLSSAAASAAGAVYHNGRLKPLSCPSTYSSSIVTVINNNGDVIGSCVDAGGNFSPAIWQSTGGLHILPFPTYQMNGIDDNGDTCGSDTGRPVAWIRGKEIFLAPAAFYGEADAIDDRGNIAGIERRYDSGGLSFDNPCDPGDFLCEHQLQLPIGLRPWHRHLYRVVMWRVGGR